ncbi:MAG: alpha/beta hydrolase [Pseudomonadales bacterium]
MRLCLSNYALLAMLFISTLCSAVHVAAAEEPNFEGWEKGAAHDTHRRLKGWVARSADESELHRIVNETDGLFGEGPGTWVYENSEVGEKLVIAANNALASGHEQDAIEYYKAASAHFGVARYPFIHSPSAQQAYAKHNMAYYRFLELSGVPVEHIRISFEGKEIVGNLYKPQTLPEQDKFPLVVVSGGIDTWKNELVTTIEPMLEQGFAVFAMDLPGTGESQWRLEPNSERIYARAIDFLKQRKDIDETRLAVSLRSFGGHFAVKLALVDEDIKAAINIGGPITFGDGEVWPLPRFMLLTLGAGFGMDKEEFNDVEAGRLVLQKKLAALSLRSQGLLKPTEHQAKLLTINGDQDRLVPTGEIFSITTAGIKQEIWLYLNDGHCAGKNSHIYIPESAAWLRQQLEN